MPATVAAATRTFPACVITSNLVGSGSEAVAGREVTIHYAAWVYDPGSADNKGRRLDCSRTANRPLTFQLGGGKSARVWEEGLAGMQVGGRRTLILARSAAGAMRDDLSPPDTALVYEIELLDVR